jgi:hypothetical protein
LEEFYNMMDSGRTETTKWEWYRDIVSSSSYKLVSLVS